MARDSDEIVRRLAMKYGLSITHARAICFGPFRFMAEHIRSGSEEKVFLSNFGTFQVKKGRVEHLNRLKKANDDKATDSNG